MTVTAVTLILTSALIHAIWNLMAKRAGGGGAAFVWLFTGCGSALLWPIAIYVWLNRQADIGWTGAGFICGTAVLHLLYFLVLQRGYRSGDLSLVYPLARGTGPTLSTILAVMILGERPSVATAFGLVLVVAGVVLLTWRRGPRESDEKTRSAIKWGLLCGVCIATYSVWDKYAVSEAGVPPILLELFTNLGVCLMLTPHVLSRKDEVRRVWKEHRREVIGVAILAPLSYIMILTAMSFTPLSSVAPAREISILFGAVLGARFLGEEHTTRRLIAAGLMVSGVVLLAFG
ncbi:MAG: DMT family transporter [Planctomycetota bacterium]|nr:DMT family transporter [Planctomycetota bacterium]MDA1250592.1 DMT family transporter [Planctomycetota bacterium]